MQTFIFKLKQMCRDKREPFAVWVSHSKWMGARLGLLLFPPKSKHSTFPSLAEQLALTCLLHLSLEKSFFKSVQYHFGLPHG